MRPLVTTASAALLLLAGCATPTHEDVLAPVADTVHARTGLTVTWSSAEAERAADHAMEEALADGELSVDEVVRVALVCNPALQARLEALGVARADLIHATLVPNPVLDAELLFIEGTDDQYLELTLVQSVLEIILLPTRRQVAEARLEEAQADAVGAVLDLVTEARTTYRELQAQQQLVELFGQAADATFLSAEMARRLRDAGNVPELDVSREEALHAETTCRLAAARSRAAQLRDALSLVMGLVGPDADRWSVVSRLPEPTGPGAAAAAVERTAVTASVELRAGHARIVALGHQAGIDEIEAVLPELSIGGKAEREPDGTWAGGPVTAIPIPLFDRGQAVRAEYAARLRRACFEQRSMAQRIRHEVRAAYTETESSAARARYMATTLLPLRTTVTTQTLAQFNAMQVGMFDVLLAKRGEIAAAEQYVMALRDHWTSRARLESILFGRLPRGGFGLGVAAGAGGGMLGGGDGGGH